MLEMNTCFRMQWGRAQRCDGTPSIDDDQGKRRAPTCFVSKFESTITMQVATMGNASTLILGNGKKRVACIRNNMPPRYQVTYFDLSYNLRLKLVDFSPI